MRKYEYEQGGREHAVELKDAGAHRVSATVRSGGEPQEILFEPSDLGGGRYLLRVGDDVHDVLVERDGKSPFVRVRFRDGVVTLERLDPFRDSVRKGGKGGGTRKIIAPIPGRVIDVLVEAGAEVSAGQPLVIVEAMKMANELRAPGAGRVASVPAVKGAAVEAGAVLVILES